MHGVLDTQDLTVSLGGVEVVRDVSVSVDAGELVALVGPNGAGKSTFLRAVVGLVPHSGTVRVGGEACHHRRDRMDVAYIPQRSDIDIDFPMTVRQVAGAGRRRFTRRGHRDRVHADLVDAALARVGIDQLGNRPIGTLSGGQTQRVFLARALAQEASVLLLDESLSGVDPDASESLLDVFSGLAAHGAALVVATHDLALARRRFARVIALNRGVVADGAPSSVLGVDTLERVYGSAAVRVG